MMMETPKAQEGIWTLIAPDGREWTGDSPLRVAAIEMRERVPDEVAAIRIMHGIGLCAKQIHQGINYQHASYDDGPFRVDAVQYCGRCHVVL